jgi:ribonuclease J
MQITIHRGTNQIGGSVTEYRSNDWRLFVDYGAQLPEAPISEPLNIEGLTKGDLSKSALLITHYHGDHIGNIHQIPDNVSLFMGELGIKIQKIASNHLKTVSEKHARLLERLNYVTYFDAGVKFKFGPFEITPITMDHSAFDANAFKIEADNTSVFHTGDFRIHGFRSKKISDTISKFVGNVDYVICEGTNVKRSNVIIQSEYDLQKEFRNEFQKHRFNIVYLSSTNIDRLFSLYHAAVKIGTCFIVDSYQKEIMDTVANSKHIWRKSEFYKYKINKEPLELKWDNKKHGEYFVNENFISFLEQKGYVLIARTHPRFAHLIDKLPGEHKQCYLSMWNGYVNNQKSASYNKELATALGDEYLYLHTSGHCDMDSLCKIFPLLSPKEIIPIHTDAPELFAQCFNKYWPVRLLQDGDIFILE